MSHQTQTPFEPRDLVRMLRVHRGRWILPTLTLTLLGVLYAQYRPEIWEATQTLALRSEAANNTEGPGRFRGPDEMKVTQETIIEIARSRKVVMEALLEIGPAFGVMPGADWPNDKDIAKLRGAVQVSPPNGAELGKTELFYLQVKDRDRLRAVNLATAVSMKLQEGLRRLRNVKARSMQEELARSVALAETSLNEATAALGRLEAGVGSDLAELRMLELTGAGDSDLRRRLNDIESEMRQAKVSQQSSNELKKLLVAAGSDSGRLLATPNRLLVSQPGLRRLKDGLVDAQIRTAGLLGSRTEAHASVIAAKAAEQALSRQLHDELEIALRGVEVDMRLNAQHVDALQRQRTDLLERLNRLAASRAEYSKISAEVKHHTVLAEQARTNLAAARASEAGAAVASLVELIDTAFTGPNPVGPRKAVIVLMGFVAGLMVGGAVLFLTVPSVPMASGPASSVPMALVPMALIPASVPAAAPQHRTSVTSVPSRVMEPVAAISPSPEIGVSLT